MYYVFCPVLLTERSAPSVQGILSVVLSGVSSGPSTVFKLKNVVNEEWLAKMISVISKSQVIRNWVGDLSPNFKVEKRASNPADHHGNDRVAQPQDFCILQRPCFCLTRLTPLPHCHMISFTDSFLVGITFRFYNLSPIVGNCFFPLVSGLVVRSWQPLDNHLGLWLGRTSWLLTGAWAVEAAHQSAF